MKVALVNNDRQLKIVDASELELTQTFIRFTKRIKNAWFHPLVKKRLWDGNIAFIDSNLRISAGLWNELNAMCDEYSFDLEVDGIERLTNPDFNEDEFNSWVEKFFVGSEIQPRDYQTDAAMKILKWKRSISEIATSAGKTLIMFMVFAYLRDKGVIGPQYDKDGNKLQYKDSFLIIVPNVSLVLQTYEKFVEYNTFKKDFKFNIQTFGGGASKVRKNVDVIIGTFQTLRDLPDEYFETVKVIACDESHFASTKSVKLTLKKCLNASYRFGVSGTTKATKGETAESFTMQSLLGPIVNKISAGFLFKNDFATPLKIRMVYMDYLDPAIRADLKRLKSRKKDYDGSKLLSIEKQIIIENPKRMEFILEAISSVKKNSLVLFHNVKDGYGKHIRDGLIERVSNKVAVHYVDGNTDKDIRTEYRHDMDRTDRRTIMVASYGTFSTGIDIKNIEYVFLLESFKSEVIIKQSFGRGMRLMDGKVIVQIIDFIDDFSLPGYENYVLKHSQERELLYEAEGYDYKKLRVKL